jgi:hypothetical protein
LDAVRAYLGRIHPGLTAEGREKRLQQLLHRPHTEIGAYVQEPAGQPAEKALTAFWQDPTYSRAHDYLEALLPVLRRMRKTNAKREGAVARLAEPVQVGPYCLVEELGYGTEGVVYRGQRQGESDMAVKLGARGDVILAELLRSEGWAWPPQLLTTYETGAWQDSGWVARELADETLHTHVQRVGPLTKCDTRDVFRVACEGVAWLHIHHIYGWSAHAKNVYRVGDLWQIGDFGRVWCFVEPDHPVLEQRRQEFYPVLGAEDTEARQVADWLIFRHRFGHWGGSGLLPYDAEREHRLKLDDLSMLGGLLVEMLTGKRWEWFFRALNKRPYCSAVYPLTGERSAREQVSAIVNRCWRGDAGGAPLMANGERGEQTVYDDPLELLEDVRAIIIAS